GTEQIAADADVYAKRQQLVELESLLAHRVLLHVNLQALAVLLHMGKSRFAHEANGHDTPSNANVDAPTVQLLASLLRKSCEDLRHRVREIVLCRIRSLAECLNLFELVEPQLIDVFVECQGPSRLLRGSGASASRPFSR